MTTVGIPIRTPEPLPQPEQVRVYVWERPVRIAHWLIVISIVALSFTGYYIYNPFIIPAGSAPFVMGTVRFLHEVFGFIFILALLLRLVWYAFGNRWSRLNQFIPTTRARWRDLRNTAKYYAFMRWYPTRHLGHNALAGAAYAVILALAAVESVTGLALYNQHIHSPLLAALLSWIPLEQPWIRQTHFLLMFAFWIFLIHHLYSGLLTASEEKNGLIESIFTGYKFVPPKRLLQELSSMKSGHK